MTDLKTTLQTANAQLQVLSLLHDAFGRMREMNGEEQAAAGILRRLLYASVFGTTDRQIYRAAMLHITMGVAPALAVQVNAAYRAIWSEKNSFGSNVYLLQLTNAKKLLLVLQDWYAAQPDIAAKMEMLQDGITAIKEQVVSRLSAYQEWAYNRNGKVFFDSFVG